MSNKEEFTAYLQSKNLATSSIICYINYVELFFNRVKKEDVQVTKADILKHLEYLKNRREQKNITRKNNLIALNHYFTFLYKNEQITENPCWWLKIRGTKKKTLYKTYTLEELEQLFDNYYQLFVRGYDDSHIPKNQRRQSALSKDRNALILSILIYQGTTTKEIDKMLLKDFDLTKATIKVQGGKKSNERILPLKATQIGLFMHYLQNIRPKLLEYHTAETNKLFLPLPEFSRKTAKSGTIMHIFKPFTTQIKSIDKQFLNFKQVRASVITFWLKTQGLRKTQYLAGHRYISSTENYLSNNLEDLTEDINKLHPF
jgi:site-specific recombinase XerD